MTAKYLLDSTVMIDTLNGVVQAKDWLSKLGDDEGVISVITRAEVLSKAGDEWDAVREFLNEYNCLTIGMDDADVAAGLRNTYKIKLPDAFQAALAQNKELTLVSRDEADFKKLPDLSFKIPYKI